MAIISEYDARRTPGFVHQVTQRYAYHTVVEQTEARGFGRVEEETQADGSIRLVMRRAW